MRVRRLIIDTDGVSDDIRAVSLAMSHPGVEVLAFTCVHGCVSVKQAAANIARAQRACRKEGIPIHIGAESAIIRKDKTDSDESFFFGKDGVGDAPNDFPQVLDSDFTCASVEPAALALIRLTKQHPDATLVCLGPLTNLAVALKIDSSFASAPSRLVIMGGNYNGMGNVNSHCSAEFNFYGDPEAASAVIREMRCPVTVVPWEAFAVDGAEHEKEVDFHAHLALKTPLASFLATATKNGREILARNERQFTYCDEIAVAVGIDPEQVILESKLLRVHVELAGQYSRGQCVVDWMEHLWCNEPELDKGEAEGTKLCRQRPQRQFVTSYNVHLVDRWINEMCERSQ